MASQWRRRDESVSQRPPPLPVSPRTTTKPRRMRYVERTLLPHERIVHSGTLHWIMFIPGLMCVLCALAAGIFAAFHFGAPSAIPFFIIGFGGVPTGLFLLIAAWVRRVTTELAVTDQRVIIKVGLILRKTIEMNLAKIEKGVTGVPLCGDVARGLVL